MALTKVTGSVIKDSVSLSGNVSVGGTLTYQDVTNVDALGIGTFRTGINVSGGQVDIGSNIKLGNAGVITATSFVGSGAQLTGITGTTINTNADNRVITGSGTANTLNGESTLTYSNPTLEINTDTSPYGSLNLNGNSGGLIQFEDNEVTKWSIFGTDASLNFYDNPNSASRILISPTGKIGFHAASPITRFQVGNATFNGGHGMYSNDRVGMANHGSLTGLMLASTYNDAGVPEYGIVFVQGPTTSNYNCWSISPDGPAKGNSLSLHYGAQNTNIHILSNRKFEFDGDGDFNIINGNLNASAGVGTFSGSVTVGYDTTYSPIQQAANTYYYTRFDQATSVSGSNIVNLATGSLKINETIPVHNMTRQSDAGAHSLYNSSTTSGSVSRDMSSADPFDPKAYGLTMGTLFYSHTSGNNGSGVIHYGGTPTGEHFFVRYKYSSNSILVGVDTDGSDNWSTAYQNDLMSDSNWYFFVVAVERNGTLLTSLNGAPLTPIRIIGTAPEPSNARFGLAGDAYGDNNSRHRYATAFWHRGVMSNELIAQEYAWLKTIWTGASLP